MKLSDAVPHRIFRCVPHQKPSWQRQRAEVRRAPEKSGQVESSQSWDQQRQVGRAHRWPVYVALCSLFCNCMYVLCYATGCGGWRCMNSMNRTNATDLSLLLSGYYANSNASQIFLLDCSTVVVSILLERSTCLLLLWRF